MHCHRHHHHDRRWLLLYLAARHRDDDPPFLPRVHAVLSVLVSVAVLLGAGVYVALGLVVLWALVS